MPVDQEIIGILEKEIPNICIQGNQLPLYTRSTPYKYLGKSSALSGEDPLQISEFVDDYRKLVDQIKDCKLPLTFKCSAFNDQPCFSQKFYTIFKILEFKSQL